MAVPRQADFEAAGAAYGIPPAVLAGVAKIESDFGADTGPSSAGAIGWMQFLPGTARELNVNPNDPRSAIFGAAKYLHRLGYAQDPAGALARYNAGGALTFAEAKKRAGSYPADVNAAARSFAGDFGGRAPASSRPSSSSSSSGGGGGFFDRIGSDLVRALLYAVFVLGGAVLALVGLRSLLRPVAT